jgi:hypothetical protein
MQFLRKNDIHNFEEWKWRSLRKRRAFFFFFINVFLTTAWAIVHYDEPITSELNSFHYIFLYGFPSFLFYFHGVSALFIAWTKWGQQILHETQGKKLCTWTAMSLVLVALYMLLPLILKNQSPRTQAGGIIDSQPSISNGQRMAIFSVVSTVVISILHHLGLPQKVGWTACASMSALWITYINLERMNTVIILTIVCAQFVLALATSVQDYEMRRTFSQLNDTSTSSTGSKAGSSLFTMVEDVSFALCRMDLLNDQLQQVSSALELVDTNLKGSSSLVSSLQVHYAILICTFVIFHVVIFVILMITIVNIIINIYPINFVTVI